MRLWKSGSRFGDIDDAGSVRFREWSVAIPQESIDTPLFSRGTRFPIRKSSHRFWLWLSGNGGALTVEEWCLSFGDRIQAATDTLLSLIDSYDLRYDNLTIDLSSVGPRRVSVPDHTTGGLGSRRLTDKATGLQRSRDTTSAARASSGYASRLYANGL